VIHGFIDGYSRFITALRASNNNMGQTVLDLFLQAVGVYGVPNRLRGDHGVENILVAAWIEDFRGTGQGSYIWGRSVFAFLQLFSLIENMIYRSVHNIRIERLWVDITAQIGASWAEAFTCLEVNHGLDINNTHHIWLLHYLFLQSLNQQLSFFAESWNQHQMQIRDGPNRSPADMFGFDMLVHGLRGDHPFSANEGGMTDEELEVYGVDWEALQSSNVLASARQSGQSDASESSWIGSGPPSNLNEVSLSPPDAPIADYSSIFDTTLATWIAAEGPNTSIPSLWVYGLALARTLYGNIF